MPKQASRTEAVPIPHPLMRDEWWFVLDDRPVTPYLGMGLEDMTQVTGESVLLDAGSSVR